MKTDSQNPRKGSSYTEGTPAPGGQQFPPTPTSTGEFRRFVSPMPAALPLGFDPALTIDNLRQGVLKNVARYYPQSANGFSVPYPNNHPAFAGFPVSSQSHAGFTSTQTPGYQGVQAIPIGMQVHQLQAPRPHRSGIGHKHHNADFIPITHLTPSTDFHQAQSPSDGRSPCHAQKLQW